MSNLILPRRRFLTGLATLFAAPAIVRAASLMPVKAERNIVLDAMGREWEGFAVEEHIYTFRTLLPQGTWRDANNIKIMEMENDLLNDIPFISVRDAWAAAEGKSPNPLERRA